MTAERWLFGRTADLLAFGGSFAASLVLLAVGAATGALHGELPLWGWVLAVLLVDVAHVWSTAWRVYFDPVELRRRAALYLGAPAFAWLAGVLLHQHSSALFWRVFAYVAVWHFVRQQVGWVALYRRRAGENRLLDRRLDEAMVYSSTLFPLLWWHANLPRPFAWFVEGDFVPGLSRALVAPAAALHAVFAIAWIVNEFRRFRATGAVSWGKLLVVASTWTCWFGGIVVFDSDYAFTVTNVLIHGVPYVVLVWFFGRRAHAGGTTLLSRVFSGAGVVFLLVPVLLAFGEEALWDRFVWRDHAALFGDWGGALDDAAATLFVPLLALPQAVHYVLDGYIWRTRENPAVAALFGGPPSAPAPSAAPAGAS